VGFHVRFQEVESHFSGIINRVGAADKIPVAIEETWLARMGGIFPMSTDVAEFAEIPNGLVVANGVIPNKTCRGIDKRIASAVTARPAGKSALHVICDHGSGGPFVAIGAQNA